MEEKSGPEIVKKLSDMRKVVIDERRANQVIKPPPPEIDWDKEEVNLKDYPE